MLLIDPFDESDRIFAMQEANTERKSVINDWAEATNRDFDRIADLIGDNGEADAWADLLESAWLAYDAEYLLVAAMDIMLAEARLILDEHTILHGLDLDTGEWSA